MVRGADNDEPKVAARPDGDLIAKAVARAKIASELFARKDRATLGRYHLLERIGSGGMGTVWGAFDPELDRRVAIKLLHADLAEQRERILAEGQALAKLAHPNVVNVFDVGVVADQVYVVMEWVRGTTLRAWTRDAPRRVRDIVAKYRAAAEGLAAVHRAALVHRDFKPDNAIVGDDGRVRVLDFGLARSGVDDGPIAGARPGPARTSGTPRYMAPEQANGREVTPASDQYAFCVSLREAFDVALPAWIARIVERGTDPDASARFSSMEQLVAQLDRDPAIVWRRRLVVGGAVAVAAGAFAIGTVRSAGDEPERCVGGRDEMAKVWSPDRRATLIERLTAIGPYAAHDATRIATVLDDASSQWATAHRDACLARDRGELTPELYERDLSCLARTRAAMVAVVDVLERTTLEHAPDAVAAVGELPAAEGCRAEIETSTIPPPGAAIATRATEVAGEIAKARVLARAMSPDAIAFARTTASHASELGYLPLVARAQLELGRARVLQNDGAAAIEPLQRASSSGLEAGDPAVAVEAYALEIHQIAGFANPSDRPGNAEARLAAMPIFESIAKGTGPTGAVARAALYNNIGTVQLIAGDRASARDAFSRARDTLAAAPGTAMIERSEIEQNLALATDDAATSAQLSTSAIAELAAALGPDHPSVLGLRATGAMVIANPELARDALRGTCRRFAELHPHLAMQAVTCWFELGWLAEEHGDLDEARRAMAAVVAAGPSAGVKAPIAAGYLAVLGPDPAKGVASLLATAETLLARPHQATRLRGVTALIAAAAHQPHGDAITTWRRAETALGELTTLTHLTIYQRYLARTRAQLALLTASPELAISAARWYRAAGGYDAIVTRLDATAAGSR